jgi:hypothetical protein
MSDSMSFLAFRQGIETRDLERAMPAFADDAVLHSPFTTRPFEGRETIGALLGHILELFDDLSYTDVLEAGDGTRALVFRARVGGLDLEGLDLVRFDQSGLINDLTVMVRPRSAAEALFAEMAPRVAVMLAAE